MKLLPKQTRVNTEDPLGHGMDAAIMLAMFLAGGYGLDRLFGTVPLFMIIMVVVGSIGIFAKFKYSYDARMVELEAQRLRGSQEAKNRDSKNRDSRNRAA